MDGWMDGWKISRSQFFVRVSLCRRRRRGRPAMCAASCDDWARKTPTPTAQSSVKYRRMSIRTCSWPSTAWQSPAPADRRVSIPRRQLTATGRARPTSLLPWLTAWIPNTANRLSSRYNLAHLVYFILILRSTNVFNNDNNFLNFHHV